MSKEEKTMSRVLIELRKVHKNIGEKANRYGRRFQYTYHLHDITSKIKTPKQQLSEEKISPKLENPVKLRVEINKISLEQIKQNIRDNYIDIIPINPDDEQSLLVDYFKYIIALNSCKTSDQDQYVMRGRRSLTT